MPQTDWKYLNFPKEMIEYIEKLIKNPYVKEKYGFTSSSEFLRKGGRDLIEKIRKEIEDETGIKP